MTVLYNPLQQPAIHTKPGTLFKQQHVHLLVIHFEFIHNTHNRKFPLLIGNDQMMFHNSFSIMKQCPKAICICSFLDAHIYFLCFLSQKQLGFIVHDYHFTGICFKSNHRKLDSFCKILIAVKP